MDREIKNAINAAGKEAQYDESAKRLLGHKIMYICHQKAARKQPCTDYSKYRGAKRCSFWISFIKQGNILCMPSCVITKKA